MPGLRSLPLVDLEQQTAAYLKAMDAAIKGNYTRQRQRLVNRLEEHRLALLRFVNGTGKRVVAVVVRDHKRFPQVVRIVHGEGVFVDPIALEYSATGKTEAVDHVASVIDRRALERVTAERDRYKDKVRRLLDAALDGSIYDRSHWP